MAAVSAAMGRPFMPHQRLVADVLLEVQSEAAGDPEPGEWAYDDVTLTMQRRGGKTSLIVPIAAHRARVLDRARIFMTAQTRDKARARWMDATDDVLGSVLRDDVRRKVSHSFEELRWKANGSLLVPFAPNEDGLHSETPDLVFVDELWAFGDAQARAIKAGYVPAFATSSGQALKMSTAGTDRSSWLRDVRTRGRAAVEQGQRRGVAYFEWSLPDQVGGRLLRQLTDAELVAACIAHHPAVCHVPGCGGPSRGRPCPHGFTVRAGAIESASRELDRSEFIRAYGNRDAADLSTSWQGVEQPTWLTQTDQGAIPAGARVALGVWVDEDGEDAAVSAAFRSDDGQMHVEIPQLPDAETQEPVELARLGVRWVLDLLPQLVGRNDVATVAVANVGPARDVADALKASGVHVTLVSQADLAAACARHRSELRAGTWWHRVSTKATAAAEVAGWEKSRWTRPGDSISALGAQTLAGWGFDHAPAVAPKLGRFVIR